MNWTSKSHQTLIRNRQIILCTIILIFFEECIMKLDLVRFFSDWAELGETPDTVRKCYENNNSEWASWALRRDYRSRDGHELYSFVVADKLITLIYTSSLVEAAAEDKYSICRWLEPSTSLKQAMISFHHMNGLIQVREIDHVSCIISKLEGIGDSLWYSKPGLLWDGWWCRWL